MSIKTSRKHRQRRVQQRLSRQNWLVLLGICVIAASILILLYATGIFPPQQHTKLQPNQNQITYEAMFREVGQKYGLDWRILACQAYYESGFDPLAVGTSQDMGLMQIVPNTWDEWAPRVGVTDPHDPYSNVLVAAAYLAFLRGYFADRGYTDERWMLVAYNWGPHNLQQFLDDGGRWTGVPKIRRRYALNILRAKGKLPLTWDIVREQPVTVVRPVQ